MSGDVEMKEASQNSNGNNNVANDAGNSMEGQLAYGPLPVPNINADEVVEEQPENIDMAVEEIPDEFPVTNLYELEDRVFTENWSIPYKKDESLGKCLYGAIKLAYHKKTDEDANCVRFMDRALPESFEKLLCSQAVRKWGTDIHEGVFNMIQLFVDFAAYRLTYEPVPQKILGTLAQVFDPDSEFQFKNRTRKWNRGYYEDLFGYDKCPAVSPPYNTYKVGELQYASF